MSQTNPRCKYATPSEDYLAYPCGVDGCPVCGYREKTAVAEDLLAGLTEFADFLDHASAEVKTWPEWKQNLLRPIGGEEQD